MLKKLNNEMRKSTAILVLTDNVNKFKEIANKMEKNKTSSYYLISREVVITNLSRYTTAMLHKMICEFC